MTEPAPVTEVDDYSDASFEKLHRSTFSTLWSFARRTCGDEEEAQDICQKAYLAVWRYWIGGKLREEPRRMLFRVAKYASIDVIRARERRQRLLRRTSPTDESGAWIGAELRQTLARLKPPERTLLLLQATAGLSYDELAAIEQQSVAAVRSRLYRARRELRAYLRSGE